MFKKSLLKFLNISLFKSLKFNIRFFGFRGLLFPVLISKNVKFGELEGSVEVEEFSTGSVRFGFGGSEGVIEKKYSYFSISDGGKVIFGKNCGISLGNSLRVDGGTLIIGRNFSTNKNCFISCTEMIKIGDDVTFGWDVNLRDSDGHKVYDGELLPNSKKVSIGNHVWVCSFSHILKGVNIGNDSIVAYKSLVTREFLEDHLLIGGSPAKIIKHNVDWEY